MSLQIGDQIPDLDVQVKQDGIIDAVNLREFAADKTIILFVVPGAFTPTCSAKHVPSYLAHFEALKAAGIDAIACLSVNDAHVMDAWGTDQQVGDKITMMADISGDVAAALGLKVYMGPIMGERAGRAAFVLKDGTFSHIFIEEPAVYQVSSAEHVLHHLSSEG